MDPDFLGKLVMVGVNQKPYQKRYKPSVQARVHMMQLST